MADLLDEYEARTGHSVPIHVDGASGGFIAPFATPKLEWDFRIPRVVSINASGHKFGLSYVGVGWVVWRSKQLLPKDLIFELHYLGSVEYSFSLNFSRPAHPIIAQYFNFVHLGFEGYRNVALQDLKNARLLSRALERSGLFVVLSDIHRPAGGLLQAAHNTIGFNEEKVEVCTSRKDCFDHNTITRDCRATNLDCQSSPSGSRTTSRTETRTCNRSGSRSCSAQRVGLFPTTSWRRICKTLKSSASLFARL